MVAIEFGEQRGVDGSYTAKAGCAAAVTKAAQKRNMILLTAGKAAVTHAISHVLGCPMWWSSCVSERTAAPEPSEKLNSAFMPRSHLSHTLFLMHVMAGRSPVLVKQTSLKHSDCAGARECVRFLPPLNVKANEIDEALEKLEGSLQEVFSEGQ